MAMSTSSKNSWFDPDLDGLRRTKTNKASIIDEIIQNGFDTDAQNVTLTLESIGRNRQRLVVIDDDPRGYEDLSHAWRLFAASTKATDSSKRGFMNMGEKQLLAHAVSARVETMSGSVIFREDGTRVTGRTRTQVGSRHEVVLAISQEVADQMLARARRILVPADKVFTLNGEVIATKPALAVTTAKLRVYVAEDAADPIMLERERVTSLTVHDPGEDGSWLYVLGMPVQEIDFRWSVDVGARLKQDTRRDQVPESQIERIRTAVTDLMAPALTQQDVTTWARPALATVAPETTKTMLDLMFGDDAVVYDPSDHDANSRAADNDVAVVHGRSLNPAEWQNIREARDEIPDLLQPAGQVYGTKNGSAPARYLGQHEWTPEMHRVVDYAHRMHRYLFGTDVNSVVILESPGSTTLADWDFETGGMRFNLSKLAPNFWTDEAEVISLLLHEFGHRKIPGHTEAWGQEIADMAGRVVVWGGRL